MGDSEATQSSDERTSTELDALERRNRALVQTNERLAREWLGVHDASAGRAALLREENAVLREKNLVLEERLASAIESARMNDEYFQEARVKLLERELEVRRLRRSLVRRGGRFVVQRIRRNG